MKLFLIALVSSLAITALSYLFFYAIVQSQATPDYEKITPVKMKALYTEVKSLLESDYKDDLKASYVKVLVEKYQREIIAMRPTYRMRGWHGTLIIVLNNCAEYFSDSCLGNFKLYGGRLRGC